MYKSVIDFNQEIPIEKLGALAEMADRAFNNRAGHVMNRSKSPYRLSYEGEKKHFACMQLGMLALEKEKSFLSCVSAWNWIDEDEPEENEDILAEIHTEIR